jgi:hypothetical protein
MGRGILGVVYLMDMCLSVPHLMHCTCCGGHRDVELVQSLGGQMGIHQGLCEYENKTFEYKVESNRIHGKVVR